MKTFRIKMFLYNRGSKNGEAYGVQFKRGGFHLEVYFACDTAEQAAIWVDTLHRAGVVYVDSYDITETDALGNNA